MTVGCVKLIGNANYDRLFHLLQFVMIAFIKHLLDDSRKFALLYVFRMDLA